MQNNTTSPSLSRIIIGCMRLGLWGAQFNTTQLEGFIQAAIEQGFTTFDHADIYGDYTTENDFGKVLKAQPALREKIQLITKCGIRRVCDQRPQHLIKSYDSSVAHIKASVDQSLKELETDYIDMLLLHRPDFLMHPAEIAEAVSSLKTSGKIRSFGVSNFSPSQFEMLNSFTPLATNQVEISITKLDSFTDGTLDQCLRHGISPQAWSPFGGGVVFDPLDNDKSYRINETAAPLKEKYNASLGEILLAWLLRHPANIQPVIGSTKIERLASYKKALGINIDATDWYALWKASTAEEIA